MQVFFSYARKDEGFALQLASDIRSAGIHIWIDQLDIRPAENYELAIEDAIKECPALLVILSPQSVTSPNVRNEFCYALNKGKKIFPVMYQSCEIPLSLTLIHYIDFTTNYELALNVCLRHLKNLFGDASISKPPSQSAAISRQKAGSELVRNPSSERLTGKRLLWVDDRPGNNRYERKVLEELGAEVHLATDTNEAILIAREISFHLIISDMGRPSSTQAGYDLLSKFIDLDPSVPFIIYAGSNAPRHNDEAIRAGAIGSTGNPYKLFEMILRSLSV